MGFSIRFLPEDRMYLAQQPVELMLAAASCDIWVEQPCGLKAVCGKCRVRVREGQAPVSLADQRLLTREELEAGWRLACQLSLEGPAVVEIPEVTRSVAAKPFGDASLFASGLRPNISKHYLELSPPSLENQHAELDLISRALARARGEPTPFAPLAVEPSLLRTIPSLLRESGRRVTAVVAASGADGEGGELLDLEAGDTTSSAFGVAVDLGSTTLAAALVDLRTGMVVRTVSRLNPQVRFGADVISRIRYAQEHPQGNAQLHEAMLGAVREMLAELAAQAGIRPERIYGVTCAGNSTMTHSALGADVTPLGQAPYLGLWTSERTLKARHLGLPFHDRALARFLPMVRSHVGGDTVAAALAAGFDRSEGWRLLIDLGTNSELVIGCRERLVATSTAAGPAFEGANITCGMRAAPGAIDAVRISADGRVVVKTVGNAPARGLCGSGLVDAVAELFRAGVIAASGYLRPPEGLRDVPAPLVERCVRLEDGQSAIVLESPVVLTGHDVRQFQLAKGAIRAGIELLLRHLALSAEDLGDINIAGAFGNFLRKTSLQTTGLLPAIDPERVNFIGNAAGIGARMVLVDADARRRAREIAARCEYVELAGHPDYEDAFCAAMPFPEEFSQHAGG